MEEDGIDGKGQTHWKLYVPDEHCKPGLEVGIVATYEGMEIGGELISWDAIEDARQET